MDFGIIYQDAECVVVDKPSGIIVHRGWANDENDLMRSVRDRVGCHVYPVHRLDRGASGAVLFALNPQAAGILGKAIGEARIEKRYLAITRGHPPNQGTINHPIPKAPGEARVPALTEYRRLAEFGRYSLVEVSPKTGRLHQIRRHMKHLSCPLIGDVRYGKGEHNRFFRAEFGFDRLALHAYFLKFPHPTSNQEITVRVTVSGALRDCLARMALLPFATTLCGEAPVQDERSPRDVP